jgi:signal transduction histidine kinase
VVRGSNHSFEITNGRYEELIGHRQVTGKPIREALPELEGQGIYELLDRVFSTGEPYVGTEVDLMIERRPGSLEETFFTFVYQPLRESNGTISAIAIVASDVTVQVRARKEVERINQRLQEQAEQLEEQATELEQQFESAQALAQELEVTNARLEEAFAREREARAEAEAANRAKAEFLATMSHELRTPLNAIGGYAHLLLDEIRGPINEEQRTDLNRINRSQRHLLSVINDILNFAKVEAGQLKLNPADIGMNEVLGALESLVTPMLLKKEIAYEFQCCDPSYMAHADPERLQQILLNLLSNAVKFTPQGGRISVVCGATPTSMKIWVTDTGIGIPSDKLQTIFEPFVQLDRGQTAEMAGTGLGLAISRDLARAMGGDLTAESIPNEGSTFVLTLPRVMERRVSDRRSG